MEKFKKRIAPVAMVGAYAIAGIILVFGFIVLVAKAIPAMVEDFMGEE